MVRKQFFIDEDVNRRLRAAALRTGVSEGEIIRGAVKQVLDRQTPNEDDWKVGLRQVRGMWADRGGLEESLDAQRRARLKTKERLLRSMGSDDK